MRFGQPVASDGKQTHSYLQRQKDMTGDNTTAADTVTKT